MRHITISGHHAYHALTAVFWILAGVIAVIAFGDALALVAVAYATATAARWTYREIEHRTERTDAEMAPVSHLRPALTDPHDLKRTWGHASWHGSSAA